MGKKQFDPFSNFTRISTIDIYLKSKTCCVLFYLQDPQNTIMEERMAQKRKVLFFPFKQIFLHNLLNSLIYKFVKTSIIITTHIYW